MLPCIPALHCLVVWKYNCRQICESLCLFLLSPSGGPVCDWFGCPATVRWPSSHSIGRCGRCCSLAIWSRGGSDSYRRAANQRPGLSSSGGSHGCGGSSDQSGVCQSHSSEGERMIKSVTTFSESASAKIQPVETSQCLVPICDITFLEKSHTYNYKIMDETILKKMKVLFSGQSRVLSTKAL